MWRQCARFLGIANRCLSPARRRTGVRSCRVRCTKGHEYSRLDSGLWSSIWVSGLDKRDDEIDVWSRFNTTPQFWAINLIWAAESQRGPKPRNIQLVDPSADPNPPLNAILVHCCTIPRPRSWGENLVRKGGDRLKPVASTSQQRIFELVICREKVGLASSKFFEILHFALTPIR